MHPRRNPRPIWLLILIGCFLIASSLIGVLLRADEAVPLEHEGKSGVWLPENMAQEVLADSEELRLLRKKAELLEQQLAVRNETVESLKTSVSLSKQIEENAMATANTALKAQQVAIEEAARVKAEKTPKWKHPVVWLVFGAALTVGLEVGAVKIIEATK